MQILKMDFQSQSTPPVVPVMQSDAQSRFIGIALYDGGAPYAAPENAAYTVQYHGPGPNNMGWYDTITLSSGTRKAVTVDSTNKNIITLELAEQALRVNGNVFINLCVVTSTGYMLHTFPILCRVTGAAYVDPVAVQSFFYVSGITSEQWLAYVTACQDAQKRAEAAAATFQTDPTLSVSGKAADAAKVGEAVNAEAERAKGAESQLKEDLDVDVSLTRTNNNAYNLIDETKITKGYYWTDNNKTANSYYAITNLIPVNPNTKYGVWFFRNSNYGTPARYVKEFSDYDTPIDGSKEQTYNFTTSGSTKYVVITINSDYVNPVLVETDITIPNVFKENDIYILHKGYISPLTIPATSLIGKVNVENVEGITQESKNLFDKNNAVDGYVGSNGNIENGNYKTSGYIPVKTGDTITSSNSLRYVAFFNKLKFIEKIYTDVTTISVKADGYLRVSIYKDLVETEMLVRGTNASVYSDYAITLDNSIHLGSTQKNDIANALYNKKWAVCGDSFSAGDFTNAIIKDNILTTGRYIGKNRVYGYIIGNRNDMDIQFLSLGGRTMATPSDGSFTNCFSNGIYKQIDSDVDYITLYFGINDEHHANGIAGSDGEDVSGIIPIGTIDDNTINTFYGAYQVVLKYIIENYPFAHIGIIVTNGSTEEYRLATIEIANRYGIPYIDMNGDSRTPCMIRSCNPNIDANIKNERTKAFAVNYGAKNLHPSSLAHEYESTFIENFLRNI